MKEYKILRVPDLKFDHLAAVDHLPNLSLITESPKIEDMISIGSHRLCGRDFGPYEGKGIYNFRGKGR